QATDAGEKCHGLFLSRFHEKLSARGRCTSNRTNPSMNARKFVAGRRQIVVGMSFANQWALSKGDVMKTQPRWLAANPLSAFAGLDGGLKVDVAVIGGAFMGITAAAC